MEDSWVSEDNEELAAQNYTNETSETSASPEMSEKFWSNDIIWQEITSYLSISDLKDLSCVNHYFKHKVRDINRFSSLSGQVVTGKMEIHVFKLCRAIVLVNKIDSKVLLEKASEIFQDTEYLEIHCLGKLSDTGRNCRLSIIVSSCPKLKSLAFGQYNFIGKKLDAFLKHSVVKLRMSQLEELHLEIDNGRCYSNIEHDEWDDSITTEPQGWAEPFLSFSSLSYLPMSLVKFSYTSTQYGNLVSRFFNPEVVLRRFQNTLVELNLHVHFGATLGLQNMKFPKLEKFRLTLNSAVNYTQGKFNQDTFDTNFALFLKNNLLSLTHLELDSPDYDISFTAVCEVLKLSKKIKVLLLGREDNSSMHFEDRETVIVGKEWDNFNISNIYSLDVFTGR